MAFVLLGAQTGQTDSRQQALAVSKRQVELRSFQTRAFDTTDKQKTLRTVMATMQDLGFVLDKADALLGTVSGTKFGKGEFDAPYQVRMTVSVRPWGETQLFIRANAHTSCRPSRTPSRIRTFLLLSKRRCF